MTHEEYLDYLSKDRSLQFRVIHQITVLTEKALQVNNKSKQAEIYNARLYLCVKAANLGVSIRELARLVGQTDNVNRFRDKLKKRGYVPRPTGRLGRGGMDDT